MNEKSEVDQGHGNEKKDLERLMKKTKKKRQEKGVKRENKTILFKLRLSRDNMDGVK